MSKQRLLTIGLPMPQDFADAPYLAVNSRVRAKSGNFPHSCAEFSGAWNAVAFRFLFCAEHDTEFSESIKRAGSAPPHPERYIQERKLFSFFVTGLAVVESFYYGLFSIGSLLDSKFYPMATPKDLRAISIESTAEQFATTFKKEAITADLQQMMNEQDFREWKDIRNILTHRALPGRHFFAGGAQDGETLWVKGIRIDRNTTGSRRKWLAKTLETLLNSTDAFSSHHL